MTGTLPTASELLETRLRWRRISQERPTPSLRIALLATYTVDPLLPYLGAYLHDQGIAATLWAGPFHQIVQQCLDDTSATARFDPHLLVVLPRFEDLWPVEAGTRAPATPSVADNMRDVADAAVRAGWHWQTCLLFVLPAVPSDDAGVGSDGDPAGMSAMAETVRQMLRSRLTGRPAVFVADLDAAVRTVGVRDAMHQGLWQLARIPYTEVVFAALAQRLSRIVMIRVFGPCRGLLVDAGSLLSGSGLDAISQLAGPLRRLKAQGVRIVLRRGREPWPASASQALADLDYLADGWSCDGPVGEELARLAGETGGGLRNVRLLTADPDVAQGVVTPPGPGPSLVVGSDPETWPQALAEAGLFDRLPLRSQAAVDRCETGGETSAVAQSPTVEAYIAGLGVDMTYEPLTRSMVPEAMDMLSRTTDLTLGVELSAADLCAAADAATAAIVRVRDRLGDYGPSALVAARMDGPLCDLHTFLVSCPVLGKGVEEWLFEHVRAWAHEHGCAQISVRLRLTGRNQLAFAFFDRKQTGQADDASPRLFVRIESAARG